MFELKLVCFCKLESDSKYFYDLNKLDLELLFSSETVHYFIELVLIKLGNIYIFSVLPMHRSEPALLLLLTQTLLA